MPNQRIHGHRNNVAGRDLLIDQHIYGDDHLTQDELDAQAEDREDKFKQRFGFAASPSQRAWIMDMKRRAELTDDDIKLMKKRGTLIVRPDKVCLAPSRAQELAGIVQALACGLVAVYFLALLFSDRSSLGKPQALALSGCLICSSLIVFFYRFYVYPSRLARLVLKRMNSSLLKEQGEF